MSATDSIQIHEWPALLQEALYAAISDVFGAAVFENSRFGIRTDEEDIAMLSFHGEAFQGMVGLAASKDFLASWHPLPELLKQAGQDECSDWLGELVNRLVGRLRARFSTRGLEIDVGTPTLLRASSITMRPRVDNLVATYQTNHAPAAFLWTQLRICPTLVMNLKPGTRYAAQGEIIRF